MFQRALTSKSIKQRKAVSKIETITAVCSQKEVIRAKQALAKGMKHDLGISTPQKDDIRGESQFMIMSVSADKTGPRKNREQL